MSRSESTGLDYTEILDGGLLRRSKRLLGGLPWRKIADYVERAEAEQELDGLARQSLASLETIVPYDFAFSVVTSKADVQRTWLFVHRAAPERLLRDYFGRYVRVDPVINRIPFSPRGEVNWRRSECEFTQDFLRGYGISQSVFINDLEQVREQGFVLVLHRSGRTCFSEREEAILAALLPHLHNLFRARLRPELEWRSGLSDAAKLAGLTSREIEVALFLAERYAVAEIAERLFISRRTVEKHVEHIYQKLNAGNRRDLRRLLLL